MATIGYARVSSAGQKLEVQREKLLDAGVERLYEEKKSGTNTDRPELQKALDFVREGDVFCITKIDRLARSAADLLNIYTRLKNKGVQFRVLDQNIDTTSKEGEFMLTMLAAFAQFETAIRADRQADGIAKAKAVGTRFGRKPKATGDVAENIRTMRTEGLMIREIMAKTGLSKATVYRALTA
ncbi:recombinase family protein [Rhizobium sp. CB3060]|uniref:recombinase family protein n=1 Tax=Rhizobium sp. CB3060 TaxID=3138255 RepID=UPI0021A4753E|nr:recombinase family protein [Rhizobium tropici]UWU20160.1 recombinase family protein [Rhizobium tropici]